jgi:hypothetical protein
VNQGVYLVHVYCLKCAQPSCTECKVFIHQAKKALS